MLFPEAVILRDPVHGLVSFESSEASIVPRLLQTREVQRLRRIRQLGLTSLAYPGAEHTRFAHSIGAAHVMQLLLARLRQIDGELPFWQRVTSERAQVALAAALLHDIGHGPFSHLFEEAFPEALPHETWTERMLLDPSSEVHRALVERDPQLPRRVAELVRGESDLPYLAKAVSGSFDVDRCDYLLRDAHATGVRYGEFDLPWLLRALRFSPESASGAAPSLAIDGTKGLSAIESFVLARTFMFQQVYFHKSTRAGEFMVGRVFRRALSALEEGIRLVLVPRALEAVAAGRNPSLDDYLELDDNTVLTAFHAWEECRDPTLADLAGRLRRRDLFKTIEIEDDGGPSPEEALRRAREVALEAKLDPDLYVGLDVAEDTPYADDDSLIVVLSRDRAKRPSECSFLLERLKDARLRRSRLVLAPELRERVREALAS